MSLHLHIDRLVIEDASLTSRDAGRLQAGLREALADLLRTQRLHPDLARGAALSSLRTSDLALPGSASPSQVGQGIAHALAGSLTSREGS